MSASTAPGEVLRPASRRRRLVDFVRELALIVALFAVYKLGRMLAIDEVREAIANAWHVWTFERALGLPSELTFQRQALRWPDLVSVANIYYASVHFPATFVFLFWLWWRDRGAYRSFRTVLAVMTGIALAIHIAYPLAPPRMMSTLGFVDTGKIFGPSVYSNASADSVTNQFAAMPSLHVGWAVLVAIGVIRVMRTRWRWLILVHPAATLAVVVATANHYWIDGIVGMVLIAPGVLVARWHPVAKLRGLAGRRPRQFLTALRSRLPWRRATERSGDGVEDYSTTVGPIPDHREEPTHLRPNPANRS